MASASGASGFLLGDDAVVFMQERGEQTWEAANEAGGCEAVWLDDCAQCGDGGGLRACCGYCHLVFHPTCLDPPQDVENWDEVAFACGLCVADAKAKPASVLRLLQPGLPPHVPGSATGRAGRGEQGRGRVCLRALRDGRHGQIANTTQGARLMREMRQRRRPPRPRRDARLATTTYGTSMTR